MKVDSAYLAAYIERCAENGAPMHLTPMERRFIADAIRIAADKSAQPEAGSLCPENMLPCSSDCDGGWCRTLYGHRPQVDKP